MKTKIAIIMNASLDIRKLDSWEIKLHSVIHPAPYIQDMLAKVSEHYDYDIFMCLNHQFELTTNHQQQIDFLRETYKPKRFRLIKTRDLEDQIVKELSWPTEVCRADRFHKHFPQHYGFFNECRDLVDEGYQYFFKLRPDIYPGPSFNLHHALNMWNNIGEKQNILWTSDVFVVGNQHRPISVKDIVMVYDNTMIKECLRILPDWMQKCYYENEQMRLNQWDKDTNNPYINVEGAIGKLVLMANANVMAAQHYFAHVLYRPTHLELMNSPEKMNREFFQELNQKADTWWSQGPRHFQEIIE